MIGFLKSLFGYLFGYTVNFEWYAVLPERLDRLLNDHPNAMPATEFIAYARSVHGPEVAEDMTRQLLKVARDNPGHLIYASL